MIKAIFFDIDGTILSHTIEEVPQNTRDALDLLAKKGIKRVVATGRHSTEMLEMPTNNIDFDAYITLNGQICYDNHGEVFYANPLSGIDQVVKLFHEKKIPIILIEKDRMYINFINDTVIKAQQEIATFLPEVREYSGETVYQAVAYLDEAGQEELRRTLKDVEIVKWNDNGVDIISKGASKVAGINAYLKKYNIRLEETAAFGDGQNDIEMIEYAGCGIAMGNAKEAVKECADFVTSDIDDFGIVNGLKYLKLM